MDGLLISLRSKGLNLKRSWVESQLATSNRTNDVEFIFNTSLNTSLASISEGLIKQLQVPSQCYMIRNPIVLEIMGITNISNPKDSQFEDSSNRVLKMKLTDGVTTCYAIEFVPIRSLSATLKPGTKLSVSNVRVENGLLLLNPTNTI
ncbi:hypothetical protein WA171_001277, partial [Blastocystis sp. BT1]